MKLTTLGIVLNYDDNYSNEVVRVSFNIGPSHLFLLNLNLLLMRLYDVLFVTTHGRTITYELRNSRECLYLALFARLLRATRYARIRAEIAGRRESVKGNDAHFTIKSLRAILDASTASKNEQYMRALHQNF